MTIWTPLTCDCKLEYNENQKWVRTIKKCSLHKEYTGQKLLNKVRKHNKEHSQPREPGTIEFKIRANFEPDWLKQVKKIPSVEKINESEFNLKSMQAYVATEREFQYALSNFLNSSRSILWYLLEEYSAKYGFELEKYYKDMNYRNKRIQSLSNEARKFVLWYKSEFKKLKNAEYGFLLDQRDFNIHKGYVSQIFQLEQGPYKFHEKEIKNNIEIPLDLNNVVPFFPQVNHKTVYELCQAYLDRIKELVDTAHNKFSII